MGIIKFLITASVLVAISSAKADIPSGQFCSPLPWGDMNCCHYDIDLRDWVCVEVPSDPAPTPDPTPGPDPTSTPDF